MPGVRREKPRDWTKYPEICDLIAGKVPSRINDRQISFFLNNVGTGVQFAAMGFCAYKAARKRTAWAMRFPASGLCRISSREGQSP